MTWSDTVRNARLSLIRDDGRPTSQLAMAHLLGKSLSAYTSWEWGKREPHGYERARIIAKIAELTGVKEEEGQP